MTQKDLADWTATELLAAYRDKSVSPVEATQAALDRIERYDEEFNAYCLVDPENALMQAQDSEARWAKGAPTGALDGVPASIKDLLLTRGWPTLRGSLSIDPHPGGIGPHGQPRVTPDQEWPDDAPATARMREAGAVLLGKTTTPELGWKGVTDSPRTGVTRNPWDSRMTSGGSSGGAATAVALGMGPLAIGTDGGGSVRIPGAFSGVVGFKPTYGRIPMYPASPFGTLAHVGPMTWSVDDTVLLLDVVTGFDSRDWAALETPSEPYAADLDRGIEGMRIAYSPDLGYVDVDPEIADLVKRAVEVLAGLGAEVEEADPGFSDPVEAYHVLWFSGVARVVESWSEAQMAQLEPALREVCELGAGYTALDYLAAVDRRMALGVQMGKFHERFDLLVTPSMQLPAFEAGLEVPPGWPHKRWTSWSQFSYPFNLTQQPAISVPCGFTSAGLPAGLHIVGPRHADGRVLAAAKAYQNAASWLARRPPVIA